jgi:hypothetical protein
MNVPYLKKYDENGVLTNPINGKYANLFQNREQRKKQKFRFFNNSASFKLQVTKRMKYHKFIQVEFDKDGKRKNIEHYKLV